MEITVEETIQTIRRGLSPRAKWFTRAHLEYATITGSYFWSNSKQDPLGIFQPATPGDVSLILANLARAPTGLRFAVKAGSHIAATGFNATTGLLIDMSLFSGVGYDESTQLVEVEPGVLYSEVYEYLKEKGRSVNGATSCASVGVAGFNLGGGYGNRCNQYGLAMDSVRAIEVVLPTGTITEVSDQQDPLIFWALKGGGNNFGIVTKWFMDTYEHVGIYSRRLQFGADVSEQVQRATSHYIENLLKDHPKSDVGIRFEWITTTEHPEPFLSIYASLFYDGPTPPTGLFDAFFDIPRFSEAKTTTWHDFMDHLPKRRQTYGGGLLKGLYDLPENFRGRYTHIMVSGYTPELTAYIVERVEVIGRNLNTHGGLQLYSAMYPRHPAMFANSPPSAWPRPPNGGASFPLPIRCLWEGKDNDTFWLDTLAKLTEDIRTFAVQQGCTTNNAAVNYNLALDGTSVSDIYRENLPKLSSLRKKIDPKGVMDRTGGFRIPSVD